MILRFIEGLTKWWTHGGAHRLAIVGNILLVVYACIITIVVIYLVGKLKELKGEK